MDNCVSAFTRYDLTVQLTLAMRHFISNNCKNTRFVLPEVRLRASGGDQLPPIDFLLECGEGVPLHALPCEVKASMSMNNQQALEELSRLERYSTNLERPIDDVSTIKYSSHCVVLILHSIDSDRILQLVKDATTTAALHLPTAFTMWDFSLTSSPKVGQGEVVLIKTKLGSTGCPELDNTIVNSIVVPLEDFIEEYESMKFTPSKPPLVYTLTMLWQFIFTFLAKGDRILLTDVDTVLREAQKYYGTWDGKSPIKSDWIKECLDALCGWRLATKENGKYRIDLQKPKSKDLKQYFCERMSGKSVFGGELEKEQEVLSQYSDRLIENLGEDFNKL